MNISSPEVLVAARAMYRGLNLLKPRMLEEGSGTAQDYRCKVAIGVVEGDLHDIGKNIVKLMLEAKGFNVYDLGKNVRQEALLEALGKETYTILALSTLMTSTLSTMKNTVTKVRERYPQIKILVGGAPVTEGFAREIGADGTAGDASGAVAVALKLTGTNEFQLGQIPLLPERRIGTEIGGGTFGGGRSRSAFIRIAGFRSGEVR